MTFVASGTAKIRFLIHPLGNLEVMYGDAHWVELQNGLISAEYPVWQALTPKTRYWP